MSTPLLTNALVMLITLALLASIAYLFWFFAFQKKREEPRGFEVVGPEDADRQELK